MSKCATSYPIHALFLWYLLKQISLLSATEIAEFIPDTVFTMLKLEPDEIADLERGKIVPFEIREATTQKELMMGLSMYFPFPPAKLAAFFNRKDVAAVDQDASALGEIFPPSGIKAFKRFIFTHEQSNEARNLLAVTSGDQFNLSAKEMDSFASLREKLTDADETAPVVSVSQHYRHILWQHWHAYSKQGLAGVAAYARKRANTNLTDELRIAAANSKLLVHFSPALQEIWLNYSTQLSADTEERFFWLNRQVQNRLTVILNHRMTLMTDAASVIITKQLFVGHSYNSGHMILVWVPYGHGSVLFYTHRTSTDQVQGNNLKRSIGRQRLKQQMIRNLKFLRTALESS